MRRAVRADRTLAERVYALLLRAYPASFRAEYGREMELLFRDRRRDVAGEGRGAALRFWLEMALDLGRGAAGQHLEALARRARAARSSTLTRETAVPVKRLLGAALLLAAAANLAYDAASPASMGTGALLLTGLAAAAGAALLLRRPPAGA